MGTEKEDRVNDGRKGEAGVLWKENETMRKKKGAKND